LKDRRVSAKSIAEQLGISRERVGFIIYEDFHLHGISAKWVPNALTWIKNFNGPSRLRKFGIFFDAIQIIS
jgi:orotate phosphoribosyltransferase-like protein